MSAVLAAGPASAGVDALRAAFAGGSVTPVSLVEAIFDRIAERGERPAWISLAPRADALDQADAAAGRPDLPLAGVPFAVKDNIDVEGMVTTAGCPGFARRAERTAPVVERLLAAGAVLIGKTNLDQFATGLVGTRSPYGAVPSAVDPRFVAGGSSSGSAVVVADGTVAFALGTDTAGSGRVPAAFNGIVGLKPSRGRLSTRGVVPACRSLDCVSIFTGGVADAARVLEVADGFDAHDPWSRRPPPGGAPRRPPRIGVPREEDLGALDGRLAASWASARARAELLAEAVVEIDVAPFAEAGALLYDGPWLAERWTAVGGAIDQGVEGLDPVVEGIVRRGAGIGAADAFRAFHRLAELRLDAERTLALVDVLVLPTAPTVPIPAEVAADPVALNRLLGIWASHVNLLDLCALAVPGDPGEDGMPFGVSLIAPAFAERRLLELGCAWMDERPPAASERREACREVA